MTLSTQIILVLGAPGGGTSVTMAVLSALGVPVPGPYEHNDDPRTPCTYENSAFTQILQRAVNEQTLEPGPRYPGLKQELIDLRSKLEHGRQRWRRAAFKRPVAAVCLKEILEVFAPTVILVTRPFEDVERTRVRRGWPTQTSPTRPLAIMVAAFDTLIAQGWPFLGLSYPELVREPEVAVRRIIAFARLEDLSVNLLRAAAVVRRA